MSFGFISPVLGGLGLINFFQYKQISIDPEVPNVDHWKVDK